MADQGSEKLDDKWFMMFNSRVNSELSLARRSYHTTHQWIITLTVGLITAVLALGKGDSSYPSLMGLIGVLALTPLLVRFFVRSCLEYAIFYRWKTIRNALDYYFCAQQVGSDRLETCEKYLKECVQLYYFQWKSPIRKMQLIRNNLQLAYLWPIITVAILLGWGFISVPFTGRLILVTTVVVIVLVFEAYSFFAYAGFKWERTPTQEPDIDITTQSLLSSDTAEPLP